MGSVGQFDPFPFPLFSLYFIEFLACWICSLLSSVLCIQHPEITKMKTKEKTNPVVKFNSERLSRNCFILFLFYIFMILFIPAVLLIARYAVFIFDLLF